MNPKTHSARAGVQCIVYSFFLGINSVEVGHADVLCFFYISTVSIITISSMKMMEMDVDGFWMMMARHTHSMCVHVIIIYMYTYLYIPVDIRSQVAYLLVFIRNLNDKRSTQNQIWKILIFSSESASKCVFLSLVYLGWNPGSAFIEKYRKHPLNISCVWTS